MRPLQVYLRRKAIITKSVHIQESKSTIGNEVNISLQSSPIVPVASHELVSISEPDLPIAIRKGTETCAKHPLYIYFF